jgi:bacterioferritin-associated ferredoxin
MFICICNGVTESQVRRAIEDGACTVHDLRACLGVAAGCGSCADFAASLISQAQPTPAAELEPAVAA